MLTIPRSAAVHTRAAPARLVLSALVSGAARAAARAIKPATPCDMRLLSSERLARVKPDTMLSSTLSVKMEESAFLVSHPVNCPEKRAVMFIVRCNDQTVVSYQLPDSDTRSSLDLSLTPALPTLMLANYVSSAGTFDTAESGPLDAEVKAGKWLVVKHGDPWGLMLSTNQASAWKTLLQSLGGKYAALAIQDKTKVPMQRHPLIDIL